MDLTSVPRSRRPASNFSNRKYLCEAPRFTEASRSPAATGSRFTFLGRSGLVWTTERAMEVNAREGQSQIVTCKNCCKSEATIRSNAIIGDSASPKWPSHSDLRKFLEQRLPACAPPAVWYFGFL